MPYEWRLTLLALALTHALLAVGIESYVCDCDALWQHLCYTQHRYRYRYQSQAIYPQLEVDDLGPCYSQRLCCQRQAPPHVHYKCLEQEILDDPAWPPHRQSSTQALGPPAKSIA